jgi:hypothetical protein
MDAFSYLLTFLIIMLAIQHNQLWLVVGLVGVLIATNHSFNLAVLLIGGVVVFYYIKNSAYSNLWPIFLFGFLILGFLTKAIESNEGGGDSGGGLGALGGLLG